MVDSMAVKGLFGLCLASLMALWLVCGWFCGLICDCLWHVQRIVLGTVWVTNLDCLGACLGPVFMPC